MSKMQYIKKFIGTFVCPSGTDESEVTYVIQVTSPYGYPTAEEAAQEEVAYVFRKVNGHIVLVAEGGDLGSLRRYKSDVISWENWQQYRMARISPDTGKEEPFAEPWDVLFGVNSVSDDFEVFVVPDVSNVFAYCEDNVEELEE